jgi:mannose-1-phosphate guanylyltransferase
MYLTIEWIYALSGLSPGFSSPHPRRKLFLTTDSPAARIEITMKAIILAGGEGTRLQPLTHATPKSMVPVLNRPFLEHTIAHLKKCGIKDIILAISHLPEVIRDYFGDGASLGVRLTYTMEDSPLGTAGAVKNAEQYLDGTFVVLNGDIFNDLEIAKMLDQHRRKRAKATISLKWVDDVSSFGAVETDDDYRITSFIEKPSPGETTSHWINAGTYILEPEVLGYVPANSRYMFERGLFPLLLKKDEPVYGYSFSGYWLDMGTPDKYLLLNHDLLLLKVKSALIDDLSQNKVCCDKEAVIHPSARITGPAVIGSGCRIGQNTHIKGPVVIGPDCHIGDGASIEGTVVWGGASIEANARIVNRVVTPSP